MDWNYHFKNGSQLTPADAIFPDSIEKQVGYSTFVKTTEHLISAIQGDGATPIITYIPSATELYWEGLPSELKKSHPLESLGWNLRLKSLSNRLKAHYIDPREDLKEITSQGKNLLINVGHASHLNTVGHREFGKMIAKKIKELAHHQRAKFVR